MRPRNTNIQLKEHINKKGTVRRYILGLILLIALILGLRYYFTHRSQTIPEIKSGIAGVCLDDYRKHIPPNAAVVSWPCNGTAAQSWSVVGDQIIHNKDCLSIEGSATTSGSNVVLNPCNYSASQTWVSAIGGIENPASALCLQDPGNKVGAKLVAASCESLTQPDENWVPAKGGQDSNNSPAAVNCNNGEEGQRVACYAAEEWTKWNSGKYTHSSLLNTYSDGNGYEEWCADFVSYVYKEAGYPFTNGERDGWDEYVADNVQNQGFTYHSASSGYIPQAGDVAYFNYPGGHVEIVAVGGANPIFIYGDSGTIDKSTGNGDMAENTITNDGANGQVIYYLSPT